VEEVKNMKKIGFMLMGTMIVAFCGGAAKAQVATPTPAPKASAGIAGDMLEQWKRTEKRLVEMAQDFPEDKFDYKAAPTQRTFAEQLLHAAGSNYHFIAAATGGKMPGDEMENPSRATYKTRAQVVEFIQKAFAAGAKVIEEQGDKGMLEAVKAPFGNRMVTRAALWAQAIGHANEHYGQCVVYYRLNGLVPPETRRQT
jgi:uncharacterized damage-inducible protein DinB